MRFSAHVERETTVARDGKARLAMMGSRFGIYSLPAKGASSSAPVVSVSYKGQLGPLSPAFGKTNLPRPALAAKTAGAN